MADVLPLKSIPEGPGKVKLAEMESGDTLAVDQGGTGADSAAAALANLGGVASALFDIFTNRTDNPHQVTPAQISALAASLLGANSGVCELDASGVIPSGRIPASARPKFKVKLNEAERLALTGLNEGDEVFQTVDGSQWILDGFGDWHPRPHPQPIFGQHFHFEESLPTSSTTSTGWQTKLYTETGNVSSGTYLVIWGYGWSGNSASYDFRSALWHNTNLLREEHRQEPKDTSGSWGSTGTDQRQYLTRFAVLPNISGPQEFALDYRSSRSGVTVSIWDAALLFFRAV